MPNASSSTAAPPIAMPAIAPLLKVGLEADESVTEEVGSVLEAVSDGVFEAAVLADGVAVDVVPLLAAFGFKSLYASQSGFGAASGQSSAKQMEYSWPLTAGAQRTLYRAFMNVSRVSASSSEKPKYLLATVN